ncbi:MAG: integrase arm-type DNA-binding domain-containing protein [Gammaproteobacteria bacterium]|nr:integrase arm-type DNA-binding domain-containing protein [Gammaproteobacteria bacterium]
MNLGPIYPNPGATKPRLATPLTAIQCKSAKPTDKPYKLSDGGVLYLLVGASGSKSWWMKYRIAGKEMAPLANGGFPAVSLADARARRDEAKRLVSEGKDPAAIPMAQQREAVSDVENSFQAVAERWLAIKVPEWAPSYTRTVRQRLETTLFPWIGAKPITQLTNPELVKPLRQAVKHGANDTAHLLTIDEVRAILRIGRTKAWELLASGRLQAVRLGSRCTRDYLKRFDTEADKAKSAAELIEAMKTAYPNAGLGIALDIGAKVRKGEMQW